MEKQKVGWGGKRAGAGRKPVPCEQRKHPHSFSLTPCEYTSIQDFISLIKNIEIQAQQKGFLNADTIDAVEFSNMMDVNLKNLQEILLDFITNYHESCKI